MQYCVQGKGFLLALLSLSRAASNLTEEGFKRGSEKRELGELRRGCIQEKGFSLIELWDCQWWILYKTNTDVKLHIRENFPYRQSVTEHQLLEGRKKGNFFVYVQNDNELPKDLRANYASIPPLFKNNLVSKKDIGDLIKTYAEEERIMSQPRKMTRSSITIQKEPLITPLLLFHLQHGLVVTKLHCFVDYIPKKMFQHLFTVSSGPKKTR